MGRDASFLERPIQHLGYRWPPIVRAAWFSNSEVVKLLIEWDVDIQAENVEFEPPVAAWHPWSNRLNAVGAACQGLRLSRSDACSALATLDELLEAGMTFAGVRVEGQPLEELVGLTIRQLEDGGPPVQKSVMYRNEASHDALLLALKTVHEHLTSAKIRKTSSFESNSSCLSARKRQITFRGCVHGCRLIRNWAEKAKAKRSCEHFVEEVANRPSVSSAYGHKKRPSFPAIRTSRASALDDWASRSTSSAQTAPGLPTAAPPSRGSLTARAEERRQTPQASPVRQCNVVLSGPAASTSRPLVLPFADLLLISL